MKIKVGDKVKLKNGVSNDAIEPGMVVTVKDIDASNLCTFEELKPFYKWQGIGIEGRNVEMEHKVEISLLELVKSKQEKTNIIKRLGGSNDSIITYDVDDREISFNVKGKIHISTLLKILLHETELYNYKYDRISPFRFNRVYITSHKQHKWWIDFIDIRTFENVRQEIIRCDNCMRFEGNCKLFIPDFLELCVERNLLQRDGRGYKLIKKLDKVMDHCEYVNDKLSIKVLEERGYIVPDKYKEFMKEDYSLMA